MSMEKATLCTKGAHSRTLTGHQPARVILLDTSSPFEHEAGKSVCSVLENIFCISSNMAGPSRIPLIGIYMLTSFPEVILPLTYTKSNFVRLHSALADIRTFLTESVEKEQAEKDEQCILQGVMEACKQFKRYVTSLPQASFNFNQLELIILTGHTGQYVQKKLSDLPEKFDLNIIKRIVTATLTSSLITSQPLDSPEVPDFDAISEDFTGLVDIIALECDQMSLQRFFYGWLMDTSSETEHIHLLLPPPTPADSQLVIKCDLSERMLNPSQLPFLDCYVSFQVLGPHVICSSTVSLQNVDVHMFCVGIHQPQKTGLAVIDGASFGVGDYADEGIKVLWKFRQNLHVDSNICKYVYPTPSKAIGMTVAIQHLEVISCLPRDSLCESVLYGIPLLVIPTACWKIDWEMLEKNQQNFVSLCTELLKKDQVLLMRLVHKNQGHASGSTGNTTNGWSSSRTISATWPPKPEGLFVLMPCEQRYFLLKSVLCGELLLPSTQNITHGNGSEESDLCVQASLTQVETMSTFNPLNLTSGLFAALKHSSLPKSAVDKARTYKRKAEAQNNKHNSWSYSPNSDLPAEIATPPVPGGRLTANHWSNPLADYKKTTAASSVPRNQKNKR